MTPQERNEAIRTETRQLAYKMLLRKIATSNSPEIIRKYAEIVYEQAASAVQTIHRCEQSAVTCATPSNTTLEGVASKGGSNE